MKYPLPNKNGVYSKNQAESFVYENTNIIVMVYVLNIGINVWLHAVSFSLKSIPDHSCTTGRHTPLTINSKSTSKDGSFETVRKEINDIVLTGRKEIKQPSWKSVWNKVDSWGFNLERQFNLL